MAASATPVTNTQAQVGGPGAAGSVPSSAGGGAAGAAGAPNFASASLYVGDLDPDVTEAMLYEVFNSVGPVASIRVCRDSVTRRSLGYAYINYHSVTDAERALDTLNFTNIKESVCRIMWSHRDPGMRRSGSGNIFVKNLDRTIDNKALYDTFSLFGNILSCKVAVDDAGLSKGYGFVHYETEESALSAIERVNNMQIGDKTVFVGKFVKNTERVSTAPDKWTNLYIKNIPEHLCDEDTLRKYMDAFGTITSFVMKTDPQVNKPFAFCNYEDHEHAQKAVDAIHGKWIKPDGTVTTEEISEETVDATGARVVDEAVYVQPHQSRAARLAALKAKREGLKKPDGLAGSSPYEGINLYIKNISEDVDDDKLREIFEPFGTITSAKVMRDSNGISRGFGFVCFVSPDEATKAVTEMHLRTVYGKPLYVGLAEKRDQRILRLQQRFQMMPQIRPLMPSTLPPQMQFGAPPHLQTGAVPPHMQFGAVPPQMQFGATSHLHSGTVPPQMQFGAPPHMLVGMGGHSMGGPGRPPMMAPPAMMRRGPGGPGGSVVIRPQMTVGKRPSPPSPSPRPPAHHMQQSMQMQGQSQGYMADIPLTAAALSNAAPSMQKQMLGEKLFPLIARYRPDLAGKITGMMLEMDNSELLILLESEQQLRAKVDEALRVLQQAAGY
eukprot:GHVT01098067.1.p1 GENE.GHVT01098067.1~~GHVT01098067.1.p1  ORF type:complete len:666 (+),score=98.72 GHVT01098067.1:125-2122(+)